MEGLDSHGRDLRWESAGSGKPCRLLARWRPTCRLLRLHADGAVEADRLAVQHHVLDDVLRQRGVLRRACRGARGRAPACRASPAPPAACRAASACRRCPARWCSTRMPLRDEVARDRQRHADHAALRRRVGGLADLAVERGDRRGVDRSRRARRRRSARASTSPSAASRIMLKVPIRLIVMTRVNDAERVRAVLADRLLADRDAGAVHEPAQRAECCPAASTDGLRVGFAGDVALHEARAGAEFPRQRLALVGLHVGDDDLAAARGQRAGTCRRRVRMRRR